jgi:3-oxosteroid 1-dehydrogenase
MSSDQQWDYSYDVVVVGSGNGGMTAALCCYEMGAKDVLLVEKSGQYGGTSSISGGGVWIPCNRYAKEAGAEDSIAKAKTYLRQLITEEAVPEYQLDAYLENSPKMVDFLHERTRMRYVSLEHYPDYYTNLEGSMPGHRSMEPETFDASELGEEWKRLRRSHPMMHLGGVICITQVEAALFVGQQPGWWKSALKLLLQYLVDIPWRLKDRFHRRLATGCAGVARLLASMQDRDIPLWLNASMDRVVEEDGKVIGIEITRNGKPLRIQARKGVVLAAGGFEHNQEMREQYLPKPTDHNWSAGTPRRGNASAMNPRTTWRSSRRPSRSIRRTTPVTRPGRYSTPISGRLILSAPCTTRKCALTGWCHSSAMRKKVLWPGPIAWVNWHARSM